MTEAEVLKVRKVKFNSIQEYLYNMAPLQSIFVPVSFVGLRRGDEYERLRIPEEEKDLLDQKTKFICGKILGILFHMDESKIENKLLRKLYINYKDNILDLINKFVISWKFPVIVWIPVLKTGEDSEKAYEISVFTKLIIVLS